MEESLEEGLEFQHVEVFKSSGASVRCGPKAPCAVSGLIEG